MAIRRYQSTTNLQHRIVVPQKVHTQNCGTEKGDDVWEDAVYNMKSFSNCFAQVKAPLDGFDIGIMKVLKH